MTPPAGGLCGASSRNISSPFYCNPSFGPPLSPVLFAQSTGSLSGTIKDPSGAVFSGAAISLASTQGGQPAAATTNAQGAYEFRGVAPGIYTVTVDVPGFALYVKESVEIRAGQPQRLDIALTIAVEKQEARVSGNAVGVDINPVNNGGTLNISQADIDALADDPDELQSELLALAGPSVGPNGGQIYVDGFTIDTNSPPPKNTIREIHVNQNPFSAAYDRVGYGRIEILTKPGTNQVHGRITADGNDLAFDTTRSLCGKRAWVLFLSGHGGCEWSHRQKGLLLSRLPAQKHR